MRRWLFLILKIAVSAGLLYLAFRRVDLDAVQTRLLQADLMWVLAALATFGIQIVVIGVRWNLLAGRAGAPLDRSAHLKINAIAAFFNQTLPSTIGGDAMRVWLSTRAGTAWAPTVGAVLIDRFLGLVALVLLVAFALPWTLAMVNTAGASATLLALTAAGLGGTVLFFLFATPLFGALDRWKLTRLLRGLARLGAQLLLRPLPGAPALALAFLVHGLTLVGTLFVARAIGVPLGLGTIATLVPPVVLVSMVPITLAGWGVREGAMIAALGFAGVAAADALAVSVLFGLILLVVGIAGGLIWLAAGAITPPKTLAPKDIRGNAAGPAEVS
jgi:uncharacterized membrane protein YbhN (UPF0104 family)